MEGQAEDPKSKPEIPARFDGLLNSLLITRPDLAVERREKLLQVLSTVCDDTQKSQTKQALETDAAIIDSFGFGRFGAGSGKWLE